MHGSRLGMSIASGIAGIPECQECWECQERLTDTKCNTFLKPQAQADLNEGGNFWNGGNVRNVEMSGMLTISGISGQTSSVIPFRNHKLELN